MISKDILARSGVRRHNRESDFDKSIEEWCYKAGAIKPQAIKAIIQTLNPEWKTSFEDHRVQRYGITAIKLHLAQAIEKGVDRTELFYADRCIRITAYLLRLLVNRYNGYIGAFHMYGLHWHNGSVISDHLNVKPAWMEFCNKPNQPASYLPAEIDGVKIV